MQVSADYVACKWRYPLFVTLILNKHETNPLAEASRRRWRERCRLWRKVDEQYRTHRGICEASSRTGPSARHSSPDLHTAQSHFYRM